MRQFKTSDWYAINDPVEGVGTPGIDGVKCAERGLSVTLEDRGRPVMCGGVIVYDDDNGEAWLRASRSCSPREIVEAALSGLKILLGCFDTMQIWCRVRTGFTKGERLIKWLGFIYQYQDDSYGVYLWQRHC